MSDLGDVRLGASVFVKFNTTNVSAVPTTLVGGTVAAYPDNSVTELTAGVTLTPDFDGRVGLHHVTVVATSGNGYLTNTNYHLVLTAGTVNSVSVVGLVVGSFSIEARSAFIRLGAPAGASVSADIAAVKTDTAGIAAKTVNLPASPASTTNITAGTVTTVSGNVNGSVASVTGAVGSVTGNVNGNVVGSVASVTAPVALSAAAVDAILDDPVEGAVTMRQSLRLMNAAAAGKLSGAATATITLRDLADTKDRIVATVDASGNRPAITRDLT